MKKFNPEKELRKIQHGNKNKIIFCVIALLLIISIGSTYALYQVRYSKRIIYTKVAPFSTGDLILSFLVDGKQTNLPAKNTGYYFDSIECESDKNATANWDYENWKLTALTATVPNKCTIKFTSTPYTLIAQIKYVKETTPEMVVEDETGDKNLRYIGKNPDNYIWFNCDSYEGLTQSTAATKCEKWRIIGLMNNMTVINGESREINQNLVKIVRAESIGNIQWSNAATNNWDTASLQNSLNTTYYNGTKLSNGKGITNATKNMIEQVTWNLGGWNTEALTASQFYTNERGTTTYNSQPSIWNGTIALIYPSDYAYATGGGNTYNRKTCLGSNVNTWNSGAYRTDCAQNSWLLFPIPNYYWTLSPRTTNSYAVFSLSAESGIFLYDSNDSFGVFPSVYLNPNTKIVSGDGSSGTPYILST